MATGRAPDYNLCVAQEYEAGGQTRTRWTQIGVAWTSKDGRSITVSMVTMPGVKLVLLPPKGQGQAAVGSDPGDDF